jgi:hypothetical protein
VSTGAGKRPLRRKVCWQAYRPGFSVAKQLTFEGELDTGLQLDDESCTGYAHYMKRQLSVPEEMEAAQRCVQGGGSALDDALSTTEVSLLAETHHLTAEVAALQNQLARVSEAADEDEASWQLGANGSGDSDDDAADDDECSGCDEDSQGVGGEQASSLLRSIGVAPAGGSGMFVHQREAVRQKLASIHAQAMTKDDEASLAEPKYGMMWGSWDEADAWVRQYGARTSTLRQLEGGSKSKRTYVCSECSSFFPKQRKKAGCQRK